TLKPPSSESATAAIHQLFAHRLIDKTGMLGGTRFGRWYADDPSWCRLRNKRWNIDGIKYEQTLRGLAEEAAEVMPPSKLCQLPMVTAHGDDHQGNVWVKTTTDNAKYLTLFDPAFASENIPALLAFAKSTYHNAIAHPY